MAMDTYYVEYFTRDGSRMGMQVSAYSSYDAQRYAEALPNFDYHAKFPERLASGFDQNHF